MTAADGADVPVVAIDGPAASGKGTIAARVAAALGYHWLDSGALYRLVALEASLEGVRTDDAGGLAELAADLDVRFLPGRIELDGDDVTEGIRAPEISAAASEVAVHPAVRAALLQRQRAFRRPPGLVAEGRDMGTVVFPDARTKVFVTATPEVRAERRHKQLIEKGISANIDSLLHEIRERDQRDRSRAAAPLAAAADAVVLDTTDLTIDAAVAFVLARHARTG